MEQNNQNLPIVLAILDGWGMSASWGGNAISMSSPKTMNSLWRNYPHAILQAFRQVAGNYKMVGNSEIGHSSIGAGKIVFQDLERISNSIIDKTFFQNQALVDACRNAASYNSSLHLIGLVSDGGIHSHIDHLYALLKLAKFYNLQKVYIHVITDGLDTDDTGALDFIVHLQKKIAEIGVGEVASITGRHFAMNRDNHWENISKSLQAMIHGVGNYAASAPAAISDAYKSGYTDQFIPPTVIRNERGPITKILDNDSIIFFNYRPDRARQLTLALLGMHNLGSKFPAPNNIFFVSFTSYYLPAVIESKIHIAFPPERIDTTLGSIISQSGLTQFRIAESEKYPHISYFFNCGQEEPMLGEERVIIESVDVKSYDLKPQMEAAEITSKLVQAIKSKKFQFALVNYANVDSVGHSGDLIAATQAVDVVDDCLKELTETVLAVDGTLIITADHGNAEQMIQVTGGHDRETFHSLSPVPFIMVRSDLRGKNKAMVSSGDILSSMISSKRSLADIAPTILELLNIAKPQSMTGSSLLSEIIVNNQTKL
ncbi:MAG: 2,3-bisphosphoglycerate-independent phosphoglycerate mutase [Candidatus Berkelbacteria bacterium]|nr:2,3-bisphosphoglycerate-independent phosphoglycerate mutase [Candidatus Berkelbacteria bacterium]